MASGKVKPFTTVESLSSGLIPKLARFGPKSRRTDAREIVEA
jgi:hypothetical protein